MGPRSGLSIIAASESAGEVVYMKPLGPGFSLFCSKEISGTKHKIGSTTFL